MTTPNFDGNTNSNSDATYGSENLGDSGNRAGTSSSNLGGAGGAQTTDDVSLSRQGGNAGGSRGSSSTSGGNTGGAQGMLNNAEDALGQLQSKASELTSRFIDNIDVDDLTQKLETQVRDHPTRTLLVALGAGFLLGRAAKK